MPAKLVPKATYRMMADLFTRSLDIGGCERTESDQLDTFN